MKIAVIGRYREASANGVDRTIVGHISQFIRLGYQVTLITFDEMDDNGIKDCENIGISKIILLKKKGKWLRAFYLLRNEFDLISLHSVFTTYNWAAVALFNCPFIITPNGGYSPGQLAYKRPYLKKIAILLFEKKMLRTANFVHALSKNEVDQILAIAPTAVTRIAPNGCIPSKKSLEKNNLTKEMAIRLVFVGRLSIVHKGLDLLISCLANLNSTLAWTLDIVGAGLPEEEDELYELIKRLNLNDRIVLHGALFGADKELIMLKADLFVHTSRWEGMPFSIIEALQKGVPVVVTPETNMGDLIVEYDAGWLVESETLVEQMNQILSLSSEEIKRKSKGAFQLVEERLDWDRIGNSLFKNMNLPE